MPGGERQAWGQSWQACGARETRNPVLAESRYAHLPSLSNFSSVVARAARRPNQEPSMAPKGNKKRAAPSAPASDWAAVPDAASDRDVLKAVMEVQRFWIHGDTVC